MHECDEHYAYKMRLKTNEATAIAIAINNKDKDTKENERIWEKLVCTGMNRDKHAHKFLAQNHHLIITAERCFIQFSHIVNVICVSYVNLLSHSIPTCILLLFFTLFSALFLSSCLRNVVVLWLWDSRLSYTIPIRMHTRHSFKL